MAAKAYPKVLYIYVTQEQANALHAMTTNVSAWVRKHIDNDAKRTMRQQRRTREEQAK